MRWKCTDTAKALCKAKSTTHSIHYATMLTKLCFSCQWPCCADSDPTALSMTLLCCQWPYCAVNDPTMLSVIWLCWSVHHFMAPSATRLGRCHRIVMVLWESQAPAPLLLVYSVDATELHCRWSPCVTGFELTLNFSVLNNWNRCGKKFCNVFKSDKFCAHLFSVALMTKIHVHVVWISSLGNTCMIALFLKCIFSFKKIFGLPQILIMLKCTSMISNMAGTFHILIQDLLNL